MARTAKVRFSESTLKKGELRKLTALRKSLTPAIADRAFAEWFEKYRTGGGSSSDKTADAVADALSQLVKSKKLNFPRGGYIVRRGRGRVIVEPRKSK
jgi:hypothetical protein